MNGNGGHRSCGRFCSRISGRIARSTESCSGGCRGQSSGTDSDRGLGGRKGDLMSRHSESRTQI